MKRLFIAFAAFGLLAGGWSCSEFDDSELSGRVSDLENNVEGLQHELEMLKREVEGINESNKLFTALLDGGLITKVEPINEAPGGWAISVTTGESTVVYKVWNGAKGENGQNGQNGENGQNGTSPTLGVAKEEGTGRLYWTIDGEPLKENGELVYATGEDGKDGKDGANGSNGVTPELMIAKGNNAPNDTDEGDSSWWVSTDEGKTWTKLGVFDASVEVTSGVSMKVDEQAGTVTFTQSGGDSWTYYINQNSNVKISVVTNDDIRFYKGETKKYEYSVEGIAGDYIIKADMLKNNDAFVVDYDDEYIYVTANRVGADVRNTLNVEVIEQDGRCTHHYFDVAADIPTFTMFSSSYSKIFDCATVTGNKDYPVYFSVDMPNCGEYIRAAVTEGEEYFYVHANYANGMITYGEGYAGYIYIVVREDKLVDGKPNFGVVKFTVAEGKTARIEHDTHNVTAYTDMNNVPLNKLTLTADMFSSIYTETGEGEANMLPALCDGNPETFWHSWWSQKMATDNTYGVYFDVKLEQAVSTIKFSWQVRHNNNNAAPNTWVIGGSNDGETWTEIGTFTGTPADEEWATGEKAESPLLSNGKSYSYLRFGITASAFGSIIGVTTGSGEGTASAAVAEFELFGM